MDISRRREKKNKIKNYGFLFYDFHDTLEKRKHYIGISKHAILSKKKLEKIKYLFINKIFFQFFIILDFLQRDWRNRKKKREKRLA